MSEYDLIVVGAGNAGLSAAATATKYRMKTLLIERNLVPGGCATSFCRGRFEFEPSLHELADVGTEENPGGIRKLFNEYGLNIHWIPVPDAFRVIASGPEGYDITMPAGEDAFCVKMEKISPGSEKSIHNVFQLARKARALLPNILRGKKVEDKDFLRMLEHSTEECFQTLGLPERAKQILETYWVYLGTPADELNFLHYAIMLDMYIGSRPAIPKLRSHELSLALDHAIRASGGDIYYGCEVQEFLAKDGRVNGVRLSDGRQFKAKALLSTTFPEQAMQGMVPTSMIPPNAVRLASVRKPSVSFFVVYLGLNRSCDTLGIHDYSVFLLGDPDTRIQYQALGDPEKGVVIANCLNTLLPDASPEGTCMLNLTMPVPGNFSMPRDPIAYKHLKDQIAERMIHVYEERTGVHIRNFIEEISVATPATFSRYLGTPEGTPYGYTVQSWDSMPSRLLTAADEQFFPGLTLIGAAAEWGDGYSSTYYDGHSAAGGAVIAARRTAMEEKRHG